MSHASSSALVRFFFFSSKRCVFLFLRFYESSVLMRFLFLSSFSAFFMLRMYNSMVRIGFESDSNRIRTGFEPESFLIFYMGTIRVVATCTIRVVPMGNEWRRRTFFFALVETRRDFANPKAVFNCFDRRKRKVSWRGLELTRFRKRAAQSASPRLVPWAKMATVKDWECTMVHTSRRTQAHFLLHPVEVEKSQQHNRNKVFL